MVIVLMGHFAQSSFRSGNLECPCVPKSHTLFREKNQLEYYEVNSSLEHFQDRFDKPYPGSTA